jgi:Flp pilus assembly protein TadG
MERPMFCRVLKNCLKASVCHFAKERSGQAAMTFALAALPILAGTGVAIDFSRIATKHTSLQQATDSAALAIAQAATPTTTNANVLAQAQNYITTNYSNKTATITTATISSDHTSVCLTAQDTVQLGIMSMFSINSKTVTASACTAIAGGAATYEIALVVDNSGSMNESVSGSSKIAALRTAAGNFINTMFTGNYAGKVKMSVVPFSGAVAVSPTDTANGTASWIDTLGKSSWHWKTFTGHTSAGFTSRLDIFNKLKAVHSSWAWAGCFETQPFPQNVSDVIPSAVTPDTLYVPYLAPDELDPKQTCTGNYCQTTQAYQNNYLDDTPSTGCSGTTPTTDQGLIQRSCKYKNPSVTSTSTYGPNGMCLSQPLLRMTNAQATLTSKVNGLSANGDTNLHEGFMWGWRTISPNAPFSDGRAYDTSSSATNQKVIVLMTDGYNNWSSVANTWGGSMYEAPGYYTLANGRMPPGNQNITNMTQSRAALDELTLEACTNAKAKGIIVYTVGFSISSDPIDQQGQNLLQSCATDKAHAFIANDANSLVDAFNQIGMGMGKLRIKS